MAALQEHALRSQDPGAAPVHTYPPTLFSDANYKASCEGMAARDMRNFAGDIGFQTFYQGIYLVLIAIATGFLKLIGFCVRRDTDRELLGRFEIVDDHRAGKIVIDLIGRINKCGVISPRFDVTYDKIPQLASDLLPSRQFGHVVLTTPYGMMDQEEAIRKHTGGKVVGFFF